MSFYALNDCALPSGIVVIMGECSVLAAGSWGGRSGRGGLWLGTVLGDDKLSAFFLLPAWRYPNNRTVKTAAWVTLVEEKIVLSAPACLALRATSLAENRCFHLEIA